MGLKAWYPNAVMVHTPVDASWLNQIEVYFSVLQRKVLTPNDFEDLRELETCILEFQDHYESIAEPFQWEFTRDDLHDLLKKLTETECNLPRAALQEYVTELMGHSTKDVLNRIVAVIRHGQVPGGYEPES